MIEIMRNPNRRKRKQIIDRSVLLYIERNNPSKRNGRIEFIKSVCDSLDVTVQAYYAAKRRAGK